MTLSTLYTMPQLLTDGLPGVGGRIKVEPEDFVVHELPLYPPSGSGEHTYFEIEKRGLTTFRAVSEIARALHINSALIGYAGLKDAHAVSRQVLSAEHIAPQSLMELDLPGIRILWATPHTNKLKLGHLAGNRFQIRVREVSPAQTTAAQEILDVLLRRGVPNYFGRQRFGKRSDSHLLGMALLQENAEGFLQRLLGQPQEGESPAIYEARRLYDAGDLAGAHASWPNAFGEERAALQTLLTRGQDARGIRQALRGVSKRMRTFYISALQSYLFNRVLEKRLETLGQVFNGDVAMKHDSGGCFVVRDAEVESPRAERFEISPTGPIFGYKLLPAEGAQGELELKTLAEAGLELERFKAVEALHLRGERRPLRIPLSELELEYDDGLLLRFSLPAGCYATNVLAEVMKSGTDSAEE